MSTRNNSLLRRSLLVVGLTFALWASWRMSEEDTVVSTGRVRDTTMQRPMQRDSPGVVPNSRLEWPLRESQNGPVSDLFSRRTRVFVTPQTVSSAAPVLPLMLKYVGRLEGQTTSHFFLADPQNRVISVEMGQMVSDEWQLSSMGFGRIVFRHKATGQEQPMMIGAF